MSTTPPPNQPMGGPQHHQGPGQHGGGMNPMMPGNWGGARMPIPGNAEFIFLLVAMILLAIIALASNLYNTPGWIHSFEWLGSAYLLSRGIAKASRVLEQ